MKWTNNGYIRCLRNVNDITSIQQRMVDEGKVIVKVIPMRGEKAFEKRVKMMISKHW